MSVSASVEVAALARLPVQLDERDLDLWMAVGAGVGALAEHLVDQVGEATGDREEGRVSRRSRGRDSRLEEVACAVELVAHLQVGPPPRGVDDLAPAVEIAVRLLRGGDELRRLAREALELGRRLAPELPGDRLEPLVDVGVAEDHAAPLARRPSRRDPQVVERPGALELLRAAKKRDLPVHPLALREQPVPDDDAAARRSGGAARGRRLSARRSSRCSPLDSRISSLFFMGSPEKVAVLRRGRPVPLARGDGTSGTGPRPLARFANPSKRNRPSSTSPS